MIDASPHLFGMVNYRIASSRIFLALAILLPVGHGAAAPSCKVEPRAQCVGADLAGRDLNDARFSDADLTGADLSHSQLRQADFYSAGLAGADLSHTDLTGANFGRANLIGADLTGALLVRTSFRGARLDGVDLTGAQVQNADFTYADFSDTLWIDGELLGDRVAR